MSVSIRPNVCSGKRPCLSSWKAYTESNSNSDCWHTRSPHSLGGKG